MKFNQIPVGTAFKVVVNVSNNLDIAISGTIFFKIVKRNGNNVLNTSSWVAAQIDEEQEVEIIDLKQKKTVFVVTEANVDAGLMNVTSFYERDKAEKFFKDLVSEYIDDEFDIFSESEDSEEDKDSSDTNSKTKRIINEAIKNHWTWTGDDNQVRLIENELE